MAVGIKTINEWVRLTLDDGVSAAEIARRYGVARSTVHNHLQVRRVSSADSFDTRAAEAKAKRNRKAK